LIAFLPPNITLPLFEKESVSRKSSSSKLSVGMGVVIGEKSSSDVEVFPVGVLGTLPFLDIGFLHLLILPEPTLSLFTTFGVPRPCVGVWGILLLVFALEVGGVELKFIESPNTLSSTVFTDPSRAFEDVVGAKPESLFDSSLSSKPSIGLRKAGCVSVGGARGGATVTGIGGFAGIESSYRKAIKPSSVRVRGGGVPVDFVRRLPDLSDAILHDLEEWVPYGKRSLQSRLKLHVRTRVSLWGLRKAFKSPVSKFSKERGCE